MPTPGVLLAFAIPVILCVLILGPSVLYVVANGIRQGRAAGIVCALGLALGTTSHIILATIGLSAILASSETLFDVVRYAGAGYLIWLGASTLIRRNVPPCVVPGGQPTPLRMLFGRGLAIQLLNPGMMLFVLAMLPQFVDAEQGDTARQMLSLGLLLVSIELIANVLFATGSGSVASWLGRHPSANLQCGRFAGFVFLALGVVVVISAAGTA